MFDIGLIKSEKNEGNIKAYGDVSSRITTLPCSKDVDIKSGLSVILTVGKILLLEKIVKYRAKLINVINLNLNLFMDRFIIEISEVL